MTALRAVYAFAALAWMQASVAYAQPSLRAASDVIKAGAMASLPATSGLGYDGPSPEFFAPVDDDALLRLAIRGPGQGYLSDGAVWRVKKAVLVYRLYDGVRADKFGRSWTLEEPTNHLMEYRNTYAICPAWNTFRYEVVCTLKVGARVVIGPTQSAKCEEDRMFFPATPAQQVFIPEPDSDLTGC